MRKLSMLMLAMSLGVSATASAQHSDLSQVSMVSVAPSLIAAELAHAGLEAGTHLVVRGVQIVGKVARVTIEAVGTGASATFEIAAHLLRDGAIAVGTAVVTTATTGGYVLSAAGRMVAFVPDEVAREMIHHREFAR